MATAKRSRPVLGALASAFTLFVWGALSHMVLIKGIGFTPLPAEAEVVPALARALPDDGLYFFPGFDLQRRPSADEQAAYEAKFVAGPTGLVIYHRGGEAPVSPRKLAQQFVAEGVASAIAVLIASLLCGSYLRRVLAIAGIAAIGCLSISTIYWIWYGFPHAFFAAQVFDKVGGWLLAGLVIARLVDAPCRSPAAG